MRRLLIILLFSPLMIFGQLGEYFKSNNHPKANGVEFIIKIPNGYEAAEGERDNTVQVFNRNNHTPLSIHIYSYLKISPEMSLYSDNRNALRNAVKEIIESVKAENKVEMIYEYESGGYPGYIVEGKELGGTSCQLNVFLEHNLFVVSFAGTEISKIERDLLKQMANTLYFKKRTN